MKIVLRAIALLVFLGAFYTATMLPTLFSNLNGSFLHFALAAGLTLGTTVGLIGSPLLWRMQPNGRVITASSLMIFAATSSLIVLVGVVRATTLIRISLEIALVILLLSPAARAVTEPTESSD